MRAYFSVMIFALVGAGLAGCNTPGLSKYDAYRLHPPTSILVLPAVNDSVSVKAPNEFLTTITYPLAEHGYYVFPVAVVDEFMKSNGVPDPAEMESISLSKLDTVFHPDSVLYTRINEWSQKYEVLASVTTLDFDCRLVDAKTGALLWQRHVHWAKNQDQGDGIAGLLIGAVVAQITSTLSDRTYAAAVQANSALIMDLNGGLPYGPYNPKAKSDPRR